MAAGPPPCPERPSSTDRETLGFVRRPMVRWLDPHQLVDTASRVLVSGVFSSYADNREMQARVPAQTLDRSGDSEMWIDYVADLGDGWNSTYTIARLLAADKLALECDGLAHTTERGRLLLMGGDQVYPVPKRVEYENRFLGPYRSAFPCAPGAGGAAGDAGVAETDSGGPEMFAIPGSHDWYDGLVNFRTIFCQGRVVGGWRTAQSRSYFAVKLPHGWWAWGVDIQFGAYLDDVQLEYFCRVAADDLQEGDRIILCTAKEVQSGRSTAEIYSDRDIAYLEREVIEPAGARLAVYLKSGRHYYCRYQEEGGARQYIFSGGGGAFLHPTHHLPERVEVPTAQGHRAYRRAGTYPSKQVSRRLRKRVWLLPPYNLPLAGVFGGFHVLLAFMLGLHLDGRHESLGLAELRQAVWESPTAFILILVMFVLLGLMVKFAHEATGVVRFLLGIVHSALQLASVAAVFIAASLLSNGLDLQGGWGPVSFLAISALLGGIGGTLGMSGYLFATNCLGFHGNEAYAPLHHMDLKHFLRLHIGGDGSLTLYPVCVDRVGRKWKLEPDGPPDAPWFAPAGAEPKARLIEPPVAVEPPEAGEPLK